MKHNGFKHQKESKQNSNKQEYIDFKLYSWWDKTGDTDFNL